MRCGCGEGCGCEAVAGQNMVITGSGSTANPWVFNAVLNCDDARACFTGGDALNYDVTTGDFDVCLSTDANNNIAFGTDGCLYVPPGSNAVTTGCGLTGTGVMASPLRVDVPSTWGFPCDIATNGSDVVCDTTTGQLKGEPPYTPRYVQFVESRNYPDLLAPAVTTTVDNFQYNIVNADPCRAAMIHVSTELDIDFDLPPNSGASMSLGEELWYTANSGSVTIQDSHNQVGRTRNQILSLAPGTALVVNVDPQIGRGTGGATYNRIQVNERFMFFPIG